MNTIVDLDADEAEDVQTNLGEEAFDNRNYDDPSLIDNTIENVVKRDDDMLPRYGVSVLLPLPLYRQNGNNSYCDVNKKDPRTGANVVNFNYYPPFRILPLVGGTFNIPFENFPTESNEPTKAAPFDYGEFMSRPRGGFSEINRSPKNCADIFDRETRASGGRIIHSLTGYHQFDADHGVKAASRLLELLMPVRNEELLPATTRKRNGIIFKGPFLDEIFDYVVNKSLDVIEATDQLNDVEKVVAVNVQREIRRHLQDGINKANKMLDETEAEIRNPNEIKKSYDPPNLEYDDAPVSTDLYCLAHVNRIELDNRQLAASETIGKGLSDPMTAALDRFTDIMKANGVATTVPTKGVMTIEQVNELLEENSRKMREEFAAMMAANAGAVTEPARSNDQNPPKAAKAK